MATIGFAGYGFMAKARRDAYAAAGGSRPEFAADADPARRAEAEAAGMKAFASIEEMLERARPDVVDVCLPTHLHAPAVRASLEAGAHVFCEKPLCADPAEARALAALAKAKSRLLLVGHILRFFPDYRTLLNSFRNGDIGAAGVARARRLTNRPPESRAWYCDDALCGGVILDLMIHDIDFALLALGAPERAFARRACDPASGLDFALATLRFKSGALAHFEACWAANIGFRYEFELAGDRGLLHIDSASKPPLKTSLYDGRSRLENPTSKSPMALQLEHFLDCVENGAEPLINAEEAALAVAAADAIARSAREGKVVAIET